MPDTPLPARPLLAGLFPESMHQAGAFGVEHWQWAGIALILLTSVVVGAAVSWLLRMIFRRVIASAEVTWDVALMKRVGRPMTLGLWALAVKLQLPLLALEERDTAFAHRALMIVAAIATFSAIARGIDIVADRLSQSTWAAMSPASRTLIPIGSRVTKVLVLAIGIATVLSLIGLPVASIVAGLGVGGLAVALAAQKTFENLFGAFMLGFDEPCRAGDTVQFDGVIGTVERIGLRSTRIRTPDRTVITIPNGQLAEKRIESLAMRDRIRLLTTVGLLYQTTEAQMREAMAGFEAVIRAHPKAYQAEVYIRFTGFGASSLDVELMAWIETTDFAEFARIRSELFLGFMGVVEKAGTGFAFPTRTLHLETMPAGLSLSAKAA